MDRFLEQQGELGACGGGRWARVFAGQTDGPWRAARNGLAEAQRLLEGARCSST